MFLFASPKREYAIITLVFLGLALEFILPAAWFALFLIALVGSLPTLWSSICSLNRRNISIDTFNIFALAVSFAMLEIRSAAFIVLMLSFANLLAWKTEVKAQNAVEELLRLKPHKAKVVEKGLVREVLFDEIQARSIVLVEAGSRIPVDGAVIFGRALVNESSVTGESLPVEKAMGDSVLGGTLCESGVLKIRATHVGKDSTIERMIELIRQAEKNKSRPQRIADQFAAIFLPVVIGAGILTYFFTRNIIMTASLFLVACADDMAVAIPLAVTASIGRAARRGVIIKGGGQLDALGKVNTLIIDKTGTLTFGNFVLKEYSRAGVVSEELFWLLIGVAEKFSEHPVGRILFQEAVKRAKKIPDPDEMMIYKGGGVKARFGAYEVAIGNEDFLSGLGMEVGEKEKNILEKRHQENGETVIAVAIGKKYAGFLAIADLPRPEAERSLRAVRDLGIKNIMMFTGDNQAAASRVARALGIGLFRAAMQPEDKLAEIERLEKVYRIAMAGDGINDAPALARADLGIAMGSGGTAVAVEAADVVILTDNLDRIPEMINLGRKTSSVIKWNIVIWLVTNIVGFMLVLTGIAGLALAAFYNFVTDFLPLLNSARLFRDQDRGSI